ncbi:hypothetical protein HDU93_007944 [Gonapodya sp. JEL0774]|nr:hypothetical protein HDU93_007944 [Gonapodya sp. JEL0774]
MAESRVYEPPQSKKQPIRLPYEIIVRLVKNAFVSRFDPSDETHVRLLAAVAGVGRLWNAVCEKLLYNSVVLRNGMQVKKFSSCRQPIKKLKIMRNIWDPGLRCFREFASAIVGRGQVTILDLTLYGLGDAGAVHLASVLRHNVTLRTLCLANNKIQDVGGVAIADALQVNTGIRELDLSTNLLRLPSARALSDMLKVNTVLSVLNLNGNGMINDGGALALAEALSVNQCLTVLKLQSTGIISDGAHALAGALEQNTTLVALEMASELNIEARELPHISL